MTIFNTKYHWKIKITIKICSTNQFYVYKGLVLRRRKRGGSFIKTSQNNLVCQVQ